MNVKSLVKQAIVALKFPVVISIFIVYAKAIGLAMSDNPNFTDSAAKIEKLITDLAALDAAETACNTKPPTRSVEARNVELEKVKADLRSLRNDVQEVADADPDHAQSIITSAAMSVKKPSMHNRKQNTAEDGIEEGSVYLIGEGAGPHEWRMSTDEIEWTLLSASRTSKTTVDHLVPGIVYYFQNRQMFTNNAKSEWSQSIKIRVR